MLTFCERHGYTLGEGDKKDCLSIRRLIEDWVFIYCWSLSIPPTAPVFIRRWIFVSFLFSFFSGLSLWGLLRFSRGFWAQECSDPSQV